MTDKPLTLRELSGLPAQPPLLSKSVVLVVDAQKEYTEGILKLDGIDESVQALSIFLKEHGQIMLKLFI